MAEPMSNHSEGVPSGRKTRWPAADRLRIRASQTRTFQADEFDLMVSDARRDGFVITKVAGEWHHT
jgi:hypothetical protein